MDTVVTALGPAFAAGFAVQQLLEIIDSLLLRKLVPADYKKAILGILALAAGLGLSFGAGLRVLEPLGLEDGGVWDGVATGLIISAGTEGFNSIMKFLGYTKENKKSVAAAAKAHAEQNLHLVERN